MYISNVFTISFVIAIPSVINAALDCKKQLQMSDRCAARALMIGSTHVVIPTTIEELEEEHCQRINQNVKCVSDYAPCLKGMPKVLYNLLIRNIKSNFKKLCETTGGKEEILSHLQCFDGSSITLLHDIVDKMTVTFDYIANNIDANQTLPWTCCGFFKQVEEGKRQLERLCNDRTGPATAKFVMNVISSIASEATDLTCGRYSSVRLCKQRLPESISTINGITSNYVKPSVTPLVPLLLIADNIASNNPSSARRRG